MLPCIHMGVQESMTKSFGSSKKIKILSIFFMIISFCLCISLAGLFSSLIAVGGFSNITSGDAKSSSFTVYAISLYKTQTKAQAREMGEVTMRKNGAGYVFQDDEAFYVFASCYENKSDAEKVLQNLKEKEITSTIKELHFDEILLKSKMTDQEKTVLIKALSSYKNLYKKLYDLSVSIDTNLLSEIQAKVLLNDIISEQSKVQTNFETLFNSKLTSTLLEVKLSLSNISNILTNLADFSSLEIPYTSQVKNTYFQVLFEYKSLSSKI